MSNDFVELVILTLAIATFFVVGLGVVLALAFKITDAIWGKVE